MIITWLNDVQKFRFNIGDYYFNKHLETLQKFNKRFPNIDIQKTIFNLDRMASSIQNNINQNLIILNTIFELSALTYVGINKS